MSSDWSPGEVHETFSEWALAQGVIANKVRPARFPGRGLGMIATDTIKSGDFVVKVPTTTILTADKIPSEFRSQFPEDTRIQAIIAAYLTCSSEEDLAPYSLWFKTWPTRQDFEDSMPMLWPRSLGGLTWPDSDDAADPAVAASQSNFLPPCISGLWNSIQKGGVTRQYETEHQDLVQQQGLRLGKAWNDVVSVIPDIDWKSFSYHWLILNTRSFYWVAPDQEAPEDRNDAMALLPFADYFNHSDVECDVKFDGDGYTLSATEDYEAGDEVYMSYGSHPNDFLLAEYGFFMDKNDSDCIYLDDIILCDFPSAEKQEELWLNQYYGNYSVNSEGVCYRTEIAACLMYMEEEDWRNHLEGSTEGVDEKKSEDIIKGWLRTYAAEADATMSALRKAMESGGVPETHHGKAEYLLRRWKQIKSICESASSALSL
ncbi:hypothetical protein N7509_005229 [Penicillium cosmopolitanum]|uniref:SET domain-containing protein n=1 Tax=Penicillium cosmopolitanum TaxID=1131564 RepID=A0A9W9W236_9EURO|nr:uncharacterized protein N7509_005229 [Penicillium cosmopolitanum]KAJ5397116.1 hypothetical protein N7509_005229 [Penicillium cosmopolitanum]